MSEPVWILPTRGRPELAQRCLTACWETKMKSRGYIVTDPRGGPYPKISHSQNWRRLDLPLDMGPAMSLIYQLHPDAKCYGWLADDLLPKTEGWDYELEQAAGDWFLADCSDDWISNNPGLWARSLGGAFCWGGELVRAVGWWALPGVGQGGIDDAWVEICVALGQRKQVPEVLVENHHFRNGKRPEDATDARHREGGRDLDRDLSLYKCWRDNNGAKEAQLRVVAAMERQK